MNYSKKNSSALNIIKKRKIKILLKESKNQECFECSSLHPSYISLNNGIFICKECVKNHLNLPKNISNIIENNLNNLTLKNIQYLCCGGNRKLIEFINMEYPNLKKLTPLYFYQTYAMDYYRKFLEYLIEGGIKPIKPNIDKAYELITQRYDNSIFNLNNKKNNKTLINNYNLNDSKDISLMKSDSFMKIKSNSMMYPKIKPIVGTRNEFKLSRSLSKFNNLTLGCNSQDLNATSFNFNNTNYLNHSLKDDCIHKRQLNSTVTDFKNKYYSHYKNNYDTDGNYDDINDFNDKDINDPINDLSYIKEMNNFNEINEKINNIKNNTKLKNQIIKRNREDTNIKVFKISHTSINNRNNNNIYTKPFYLNTFQNNYKDNKNYLKNLFIDINTNNYEIKNKKENKHIINSIEKLRKSLNTDKYHIKEKYLFNLKANSNKSILTDNSSSLYFKEQKGNKLNNINNSIIINRNLNVFYNNNNKKNKNNNSNSLKKIFKKKAIGNSFSISEKKHRINKSNYSIEKLKKYNFNIESNGENFKPKKNVKDELKKKICNKTKESNNVNNFIKVNKINKLKVNKTFNYLKNKSSGNIFIDIYNSNNNKNINNINNINNTNNINNINNNRKYINDLYEEKTKIIQRISRVMKVQKERNEKLKSLEKIKVNQKEKNNKIISRNEKNSKLKYIGVTTIQQKKEQEEKNKSNTEKKIRINKSYNNLFDRKKRSLLLMKELINIPFGKKRTILEIIKTNNLSSKSVSPSSKRIFINYTDPKVNNKIENISNFSLK